MRPFRTVTPSTWQARSLHTQEAEIASRSCWNAGDPDAGTYLGETVVGGRTVHRFDHSWSLFDDTTETEYRSFDGTSIRSSAATSGAGPLDYAELPGPMKALMQGAAKVMTTVAHHV